MSRSPLPNEPPLLDPERALRLAEDARVFLQEPAEWAEDDGASLAITAAHDATLLALEVAIDTGDPDLLAATLDVAEEAARGRDDLWEFFFASAAKELLPHVGEITNRVRECARSKSNVLRYYTAGALGPRAIRSMRGEGDDADAEAAQIVFALARDKDGWVREGAREALGGAAPPVWAPFFPRDPLASLPAADAARLRGPLDRAAALLDKVDGLDASALAAAIEELPDELALPLLEAFVRIPCVLRAKGAEALLERWTCDADGDRLLAWLAAPPPHGSGDGQRMGAALARLRSTHAAAIGVRIARFIVEHDDEEHIDRVSLAEATLKACWPDGADPTPLLEPLLGAPIDRAVELGAEPAYGGGVPPLLHIALAPRAAFAHIVEPLVGAFLAGFPGRWRRVSTGVSLRLLEVSHPKLRAHAEAQLRDGTTNEEIAWALRYLVMGGHDPASDLEPAAILGVAALDPRLRAAMIDDHSLCVAARDLLRRDLSEGALNPHEAIALARVINWSGEKLTPPEQAAVSRARELAELDDRREAMLALPVAEDWTADDQVFVERLLEEHGADGPTAVSVVLAMTQRPARAHVPLLERLLARPLRPDIHAQVRRAIARCREAGADE